MAQVTWSKKARNDLRDIVRYIARDKPATAELYAHRIFKATRRLKDFPNSGRAIPEENENNLREIIFGNYRIIYKVDNDSVIIVTVHHSSQILRIS
jgi:toxin ParE1/3/4